MDHGWPEKLPRVQLRYRVRRAWDQSEPAAAPDAGLEARTPAQRPHARLDSSSAPQDYAAQQASQPASPPPRASRRPCLLTIVALVNVLEVSSASLPRACSRRLSPSRRNNAINLSGPPGGSFHFEQSI